MHKLACVMFAASLGAALIWSGGAPYEDAARHLEINQSVAADVIKNDAHQAIMREALDQPPLPAGMKVVVPEPGGGVRIIARNPIAA